MTIINLEDLSKLEQWLVVEAAVAAGVGQAPTDEDYSKFEVRIWGQDVDFKQFVKNLAAKINAAHEAAVTQDRNQFAHEHRVLTEGYQELQQVMGDIARRMEEAESSGGHPTMMTADSLMFVIYSRGERTSYTGLREAMDRYEVLKGAKIGVRLYVQQTIPGAPVIESLMIAYEK